jgi:cellulose synthase/poly-beta-1,6-N-acetylglucosamine synthase-like glycosyltransferase
MENLILIKIIFWVTLGLIIYAYFGFTFLLLLRGLLFRRPIRKADFTPFVSIIITAHNEASSIREKIENLLNLDYPPEKRQIIIASDGSSDGTNEIAEEYTDQGVKLFALPRKGKIPTLNRAAENASGEILVFSDANSMLSKNALRNLVSPFADPEVGAVGGNQCYTPDSINNTTGSGENMYWSFDRTLKTMQSESGSMTSSTGAIHAIRRELFQEVPLSVCDDLVISTRAIIKGKRLAFAPDAIAYEPIAPTDKDEFKRKVRIISRALYSLWIVKELLNPFRYGFYAIQLISHKLLRWSVGWFLIILFGVSLGLYNSGLIYRLAIWGQVVFYGFALIAHFLRNTRLAGMKLFKPLYVIYYFCLANYAAILAWIQWIRGKRIDIWESSRQTQEPGKIS